MGEHEGIWALVSDHIWGALMWVGGVFAMLIGWIYRSDRARVESMFAAMKKDHGQLMAIVNQIDSTRPMRTELSHAVDSLREEMTDGMSELRSEMRKDFAELRTDITSRLDTLILIQRGKQD